MTHSLYELSDERDNTDYQLAHKIKLTAESGAIASCVRETRGAEPGGWHMNERELLGRVGDAAHSQAVVVDLKPHAQDLVSLYLMKGILGYSYAEWTPLCFLFEMLFDDQPEPDPMRFKQRFTCEKGSQGTRAVSFVYLRRGTQGGKAWNWGHICRVNGAILLPDAWRYFDREIRFLGWLD
jgi:hypothetical protein